MHFLEAQPMAALHLHLRRELPGLPREHVFFHGSHYGLSFIDVGQNWKGQDDKGKSRLSFISSNYGALNAVSKEGAKNLLLKDGVWSTNGGAICAEGNLTLENTMLKHNFENGLPKAFTLLNPAGATIIGNVELKN